MLVFCSLLFSTFIFYEKKYVWQMLSCIFFFLAFVSLFNFFNYGWWVCEWVFSLDSFSSPLVALSLWLSVLMLMANWNVSLKKNSELYFVFLVFFLVVVLIFAFSVNSFFLFYIFFELSLVPTFLLILGWGYQPERMSASMYMVIYTVGASLPLLGCMLKSFLDNDHLSFFLPFFYSLYGFYGKVFFFLFILAFLVKIPVFFVHLWLPKAHVEAPVAGSMILAGVLLKLGGYGLVRVLVKVGYQIALSNAFYFSFVLWGGVVTSFICLRQVDVKALIAYSSIGHMGMFVAGTMTNNVWGWYGGFLMLLAHGLCSPAMFALANIVYESIGSRSLLMTKGMISFFPFFSLLWFLVCSSNMGAPSSLNLVSEICLFIGVVGTEWCVGSILAFISFLGAAYSLYLYTATQHGKSSSLGFSFLSLKIRSAFMVLLHWLPLNFLFLSLFLFENW